MLTREQLQAEMLTKFNQSRAQIMKRDALVRRKFDFIDTGNRTYVVPPGGSIQAAINKVNAEGGGTVQLIPGTYTLTDDLTVLTGVNILGAGMDVTTLDFDGTEKGLIANDVDSFTLSDFTITGSDDVNAAFNFVGCQSFYLRLLKATKNKCTGFRFSASGYFFADSLFSTFNLNCATNSEGTLCATEGSGTADAHGFFYDGDDGFLSRLATFINCTAQRNGGYGFYVLFDETGLQTAGPVSLHSCYSTENTLNGFYLNGGTPGSANDSVFPYLSACNSFLNIDTAGVSGTYGSGTEVGIRIRMDGTVLVGCSSLSHADDYSIDDDVEAVSLVSCRESGAQALIDRVSSLVRVSEKKIYRMQNKSGGTVNEGDTVIFGSAPLNEFTTTTTGGDPKITGMVLSTSIANNSFGDILALGHSDALKVNGTTDIAIGDFLSAYSEAGIAAKAASGHTAFAIALEAYATNDSLGVIDALLITPRYIA